MQVYSTPLSIDQINRRKKHMDLRPSYQRTLVWNLQRKRLLIDSILRGYDVPKFYVRKVDSDNYEVVDGQQRISAIWDFLDNKFDLDPLAESFPAFGDLSGMKMSDLPVEAEDWLLGFSLSFCEIQEATEVEIRDLFKRLQEGVSLNPAEKRHAMMGNLRDFVMDLATENPHAVFSLTSISNKRFGWEDLVAHVTRLELADGPADVSAASLAEMIEQNAAIPITDKRLTRVKSVLNRMGKVLSSQPPEMDIKWGFVDLYLAISVLDKTYILNGREGDICTSFVSFEQDRRSVDDPSDLLVTGHDEWDRDLYDYITAFQREGNKKSNIEIRHGVYVRRILRDLSDLKAKDPNRAFTTEERRVIWRDAGESCQKCHKTITFDQMHADHIVPHSKGGATVIANAQSLCATCNLSKGSSGE